MSGWQTFIIAILTALPGIVVAVTGLLLTLKKVAEVHQIVNSQRSEMRAEIDQLKNEIADRRVEDAKKGL